MDDASHRVVIVGASLGGVTTAESLRAEGFDGDILLIGAERDLPYSRPPLSKQVLLGEWEPERAHLRTRDDLRALGIHLRLGEPATALDRAAREVVVGSDRVGYDTLVVATGVGPREHAVAAAPGVIRSLRTIDDARALRDGLRDAHRVVVIGSGVLGSEIASAARRMGRHATLIGRSPHLTLGATGSLLSQRLVDLHREHDVDVRLGVEAIGVEPMGSSHRVALSDGSHVDGDLVVTAVGGTPHTQWLQSSGLTLDDGVVCDGNGRAARDVFAVGDVARWQHPESGVTSRVEHQASAIEQALSVAATIATGCAALPGPPFFWADIHGVRIQAYGTFDASSPLVPIDGDGAERIVWGSTVEDRLTGVIGWNAARLFRDARALVDRSASLAHERTLHVS
jgi:NADPH-dependent 2,4-dienoyl-CoA reductase/sulfur reductase-like enzyme